MRGRPAHRAEPRCELVGLPVAFSWGTLSRLCPRRSSAISLSQSQTAPQRAGARCPGGFSAKGAWMAPSERHLGFPQDVPLPLPLGGVRAHNWVARSFGDAPVTSAARQGGCAAAFARGAGADMEILPPFLDQISQREFTEKAWEAVVAAPEIARNYSQQVKRPPSGLLES